MPFHLRRMLPAVAMLLVAMVFGSSVADAAGPPMDAGRAKQALEARGIGSAVKVRQGDGAMHRGTIVSLGEQSFVFQEKGRPPWGKDWSRAGHWGSGLRSAACDWGGRLGGIAGILSSRRKAGCRR